MPLSTGSNFAIFPLHLILQTPDGPRCGCGWTDCPRVGKHPACDWGDLIRAEKRRSPDHPRAGYGIATGERSGVFVVDLDGEEASFKFDELGGSAETYTVETGRPGGGWQLYFKLPEGVRTHNTVKELWTNGLKGEDAQGIDTRGEDGYVVMSGSPHVSGKIYRVVNDVPPAEIPAWLLTWIKARPARSVAQVYPGDVTDATERAYRRTLYTAYLREEARPCVKGQGGDQTLFPVVQRGAYDLQLPVADVLELIREHYDPRCDPPWGSELEERVTHKSHDAKTNSTRPRIQPLPWDLAHRAVSASGKAKAKVGGLGEVWGGWAEPVLPPVYLLEGLIPENKVCVFFAEGGSVKSWCAFSLAISVATGQPWLGKSVQQGRALILDYEDGRYEFQRRMRILGGGVINDLPELGYLYCGPQLDKQELWLTLATMGLKLIVVDTLGAGMPPNADQNATSFSEAIKLAGRFTECGCTVVFVAHANKNGGLRGSSDIRDQSDVVFAFEPVSETDDIKRMRMICNKPGPQKRPLPVNVELSDEGLRTFEDEANQVSRNASTPEAIQAAILLNLAGGPVETGDKLRKLVGSRGQDVDDARKILEGRGEVRKIPDVGFVLNDERARTDRVLAQVHAYDGWTSEGQLADAAFVTAQFVRGLTRPSYGRDADGKQFLKRGPVIARRSTGDGANGFIEVES